jgi:hypothetical protein
MSDDNVKMKDPHAAGQDITASWPDPNPPNPHIPTMVINF